MALNHAFVNLFPIPEGFSFDPDGERPCPLQDLEACRRIFWNSTYARDHQTETARQQWLHMTIDNLIVLFRVLMFYKGILDNQPSFWSMVGKSLGSATGEEAMQVVWFYVACRAHYIGRTPSAQLRSDPTNCHELLCNLVDQWMKQVEKDPEENETPLLRQDLVSPVMSCLRKTLITKRSLLFDCNHSELPRIEYLKKQDRRLASKIKKYTKYRRLPTVFAPRSTSSTQDASELPKPAELPAEKEKRRKRGRRRDRATY